MNYLKKVISKTGFQHSRENERIKYISTLQGISVNSDIPQFTFIGYQTWAKCITVQPDGDSTCIMVFQFNGQLYKFRCLLYGLCSEQLITDIMLVNIRNMILGRIVYIECVNQINGIIHIKVFEDNLTTRSINEMLIHIL